AGTVPAPVAVSASDTIANTQMGPNGCDVRVINAGASPDTVTITDPNLTTMGDAAQNPTVSVANGTTKVIRVPLSAINQATGLATIAHSFITSVTCEVWTR